MNIVVSNIRELIDFLNKIENKDLLIFSRNIEGFLTNDVMVDTEEENGITIEGI